MSKLYKQREQVKAMKILLSNYKHDDQLVNNLENCPLCSVIDSDNSCRDCVWTKETGGTCLDAMVKSDFYDFSPVELRNRCCKEWVEKRTKELEEWIKKYDDE